MVLAIGFKSFCPFSFIVVQGFAWWSSGAMWDILTFGIAASKSELKKLLIFIAFLTDHQLSIFKSDSFSTQFLIAYPVNIAVFLSRFLLFLF